MNQNVNLSREIFDCFFCHPDTLCVKRDDVVKQFPQAANWPIVGEHELGNGVYLFHDFDFDRPSFTTAI